jgi:hypothetical protein
VEQQQVAQQSAMPADIESILQPSAAAQAPVEPAPQTVDPTPQPQPHQVPAQAPAPNGNGHMVPLSELLDTRHRAQAAEAKAQEVAARLESIQRHLEAQQRPQPQPIDPVADPEGAFRVLAQQNAALQQQMHDQAMHQRANTSEMLARQKYGDAAVDAAREAAVKAGLGTHFLTQSNPYEAVMTWDRGQKAARDIGDPAAYREKIKAEILAELRGQPAPAQTASVPQNIPPSLSTATRANGAVPVVESANDFFKSMFQPKAR